jgi:hypothetical protein
MKMLVERPSDQHRHNKACMKKASDIWKCFHFFILSSVFKFLISFMPFSYLFIAFLTIYPRYLKRVVSKRDV